MWNDVVDLRDFYGARLGQAARRVVRRRLRTLWPDVKGQSVLGLGYAVPYLGAFQGEAERIMAVMPAALGVIHWPQGGANATTLADETELPFPDRSIDRVLLVHTLESCPHVEHMMREVWRILGDGGRLMVVVPNRNGLWAALERTPLAVGRPYTSGQLNRLLRENMFMPETETGCLYFPPSESRMILSWAPALEQIGSRWLPRFAGALITEASKQYYAIPAEPEPAKRPRLSKAFSNGLSGTVPNGGPMKPSGLREGRPFPGKGQ